MKISLLEPIGVSADVIKELSQGIIDRGHEFVSYDTKTTDPKELVRRSAGSDIVMIANNPYPEEVVKSTDVLKMLSVAFTGIDHIATQACKDKDIMVCNASGYSNETVAELVLGMAVSAYRNLVLADLNVRGHKTSAGIGGMEICGKTVGIIGLGKIGKRTAELFLAFGAKVVAYNRSRDGEMEKKGVVYQSLEEVLSGSDIISLNLPLNTSTRGFLDRDRIAMMKKNAVFINCARGPIVDNQALADALNEERLAYACIDVFDMEPPIPEDYPLLHAKNTLLTPHIAFISKEAMLRRAKIVFENVYAYLDGQPQNVCKL